MQAISQPASYSVEGERPGNVTAWSHRALLLASNDHGPLLCRGLVLFLSYCHPGLRVKIPQFLLKGIEIGIQRATGTLTIHGQNSSD